MLGTEDRDDILKGCDFVSSALLKATYLVTRPADLGLSGPHHRGMWHGQLLPRLALDSAPGPGGRDTGARVGDPCFKLSPLPIKRRPVPSTGREGPHGTSHPRLPALGTGRTSHAGANTAMWTAAIRKINMPPGAIWDEAITSPSPLAAWVSEGRQ